MISKYDILYLAKKAFDEMETQYHREPNWSTWGNLLLAAKRLDDAVLYYEGKLKFKEENARHH